MNERIPTLTEKVNSNELPPTTELPPLPPRVIVEKALEEPQALAHATGDNELTNSIKKSVDRLTSYIEKTEKERDQAVWESTHDTLTELLNRKGLDDAFEKILTAYNENGTPFVVLGIDLDGFKAINDICGHGVGDKTLQQIANNVRAYINALELDSDEVIIARQGGDEFTCIIPTRDTASVPMFAEGLNATIRDTVGGYMKKTTPDFPGVAASIGVVSSEDFSETVGLSEKPTIFNVSRLADELMYTAKKLSYANQGDVRGRAGNGAVVTYERYQDIDAQEKTGSGEQIEFQFDTQETTQQ